jgi:hypothetical protein
LAYFLFHDENWLTCMVVRFVLPSFVFSVTEGLSLGVAFIGPEPLRRVD